MGNFYSSIYKAELLVGQLNEIVERLKSDKPPRYKHSSQRNQTDERIAAANSYAKVDRPNEDLDTSDQRYYETERERILNEMVHHLQMFSKYMEELNNLDLGKRSKKTEVVLQLYCGQKTDLTTYAVGELVKKVNIRSRFRLKLETFTTQQEINSSKPLIVICFLSRRLNVDFEDALSGVTTGRNVAVLMFHYQKKHVQSTLPSDNVLTTAESKNVGKIIDMAIYEGLGLYDCEMNRNALETLITFIETTSV